MTASDVPPIPTLERTDARLVIGGWRTRAILTALLFVAVLGFFFFQTLGGDPLAVWGGVFMAAILASLLLRMTFWERIEFDAEAGEVRFDQLRPLGHVRRTVALKPVSRVEVEAVSNSRNKPRRRLVLVTGHQRTPFTELYTSRRYEAEQAYLNDWLTEVFAEQWRESAAKLRERGQSDASEEVPEGVTRIRHPKTGLTLDIPEAWSASVSLDRLGPLRLFGVTLRMRFARPGEERPLGDGGDWNRLTVRGAKDAGLKLTVHAGPLDRTLDDILADPWSKMWGLEVLQTTPSVEIGQLKGFSIARRIEKGGSTPDFGKVSAPVATRQVWLGNREMHLEAVGLARLEDADIQHAIEAMLASLRLPSGETGE